MTYSRSLAWTQRSLTSRGRTCCTVARCRPDRGFVLHSPGASFESTLPVSEKLHLTTSRDILDALASGQGPERAIVALGYAGWDAGQLEEEMARNAWLTVPVDVNLLFEVPAEDRWQAAGRLLGINLLHLCSDAGHA